MRWKNSLAIPVIALLLVVAIGMMLIGYVVNDRVFYTALEEREKDKANSIRFATRSIIDAEVRKLSTLSGILKTDDGLVAAIAHYHRTGGDIRPLKAALDDLFWRIDTQIFLVTDTDGVVLYRANEPLKRGDRHLLWGFEEAVTGTDVIGASEGPKGWAIRALAPLRTGKRISGVLFLGTRLDDAFAAKISNETGAKISFANLNGVMSGSGRNSAWPPDPSLIRHSLLEQVPVFRMNLDGYKATQYTPIKVIDETFCLVIETDMGIVRGMLHRNRMKLFKTGVLLLAVVLLLGIAATYLLVRPLKKLQRETRTVVREFTGADLPLNADGNEIHTLESAFARMVEAIRTHISAREKAENELRHSGEQLRQAQKMDAVGRLAGGVAHDFNNLLTVINGYSEVLLRRLRNDDPARREIEEIRKAGDRAAALTRQLLAFSRKQVMKLQTVMINEVISNLGTMLRRLIGEDIDLSTTLGAGLWPVKSDPHQIEQVVLNLAVNARDAMPSGGRLSLSTANVSFDAPDDRDGITIPAGRYVRLEIADTGCGMDVETRSRIFEPFFTTKEKGKGTGLGLAMVHGIVMQTGGHIRLRSAPGSGTTFEIYLPVGGTTVEPEETVAITEELHATSCGGETVLVVEDEESVRELVMEGLERDGYSILSAGDGNEAIAAAGRHEGTIDLLLTDLVMPGMNGLELARHLMPLRPAMKVICMSGHSEEAIERFQEMGSRATFLQKPVTPSIISRKVREALDAASA
ncbi:MAG: ATP-binding protein [bacterium]|nr:ATP-binding protein [bacterium]